MTRRYDVAVMHDFFVDRLVRTGNVGRFAQSLSAKAGAGGGGIHGVPQSEVAGGNAVNLARALGRLGLRVLLITHSDAAHGGLLSGALSGLDLDLRVKNRDAGLTVALEGEVNVMLGHVGGAGDFGPELLEEEDWDSIGAADVVCSVNWAANAKGTPLLVALRKRLRPGQVLFFDPADFRDRLGEFRELLSLLKRGRLVDWVSLNEHEAVASSALMGLRSDGPAPACSQLAAALHAELDVHTEREAFASDGTTLVAAPAVRARPLRLTGAGDVWNAASIYGRTRRMKPTDRLRFANAAARLYLTSREAAPPDRAAVEVALGR